MFKWLTKYNKSSSQTKYFTLNAIVYGLALLITSVYCYARLDFVRSYRTPPVAEVKQNETLKPKNPVDAKSTQSPK